MASKFARQIAQRLLAHNLIYMGHGNDTAQLVDKVIEGKTISAKEVARLQENERILNSAIDANHDLLRKKFEMQREIACLEGENNVLAGWYVAAKRDAETQEKNSQSLQEKLTISVQNESQLRKEIEHLQKTGTALASYIILQISGATGLDTKDVIVSSEPEQISPPPCLKPLDAMKWNEQIVFGNTTSGS